MAFEEGRVHYEGWLYVNLHCEDTLPVIASESIFNLEAIQWEDIDVDDSNIPTGLFGMSFNEFSLKPPRTICSRLKLKGVKNVKKQ